VKPQFSQVTVTLPPAGCLSSLFQPMNQTAGSVEVLDVISSHLDVIVLDVEATVLEVVDTMSVGEVVLAVESACMDYSIVAEPDVVEHAAVAANRHMVKNLVRMSTVGTKRRNRSGFFEAPMGSDPVRGPLWYCRFQAPIRVVTMSWVSLPRGCI
jgi:hypothetical protein